MAPQILAGSRSSLLHFERTNYFFILSVYKPVPRIPFNLFKASASHPFHF